MNQPTSTPTLRVLLPLPLADFYDYLPLIEEGHELKPTLGSIVEVPFGSKQVMDIVRYPCHD